MGKKNFGTVLFLTCAMVHVVYASPKSHHYTNADATMNIIALDDDMVHVEYTSGKNPAKNSITTTPFVHQTNYEGPTVYQVLPNGFQTKRIKAVVYQQSLCVRFYDLREKTNLTKICPHGLDQHIKSIRLDPAGLTNAYGLGQQLSSPGQIDGDWTALRQRHSGPFGNIMEPFDGGNVGNTQIPVLYALGKQNKGFALYLDNEFKQDWFFSKEVWRGQVHGGNALRFFLMTGESIQDLRASYMELTGKPPVPPKKMFGLWLSEYGYDDWNELDAQKDKLMTSSFPIDGFVMDNQWFGGLTESSTATAMGRFAWNPSRFPNAKDKTKALAQENIGLVLIEEPYVGQDLYRQQKNFHKYMVKDKQGKPVLLDYQPWWGIGSMLDFTNPKIAKAWFDWKRAPLIKEGILGFWTDLGEPEQYIEDIATYDGGKNHAQVHNLYNFLWNESIYDGYKRNAFEQRPFMLSRSGAPGSQRFGVALWSGDIGARASSLAAHYNAQLHLSLSGIDYYGSDIGGFWREAGPAQDTEEYKKLYTIWLANAVWTDVPIRPHTFNKEGNYETSPAVVGMVDINRANLMLRYELLPYYYSLAHQAFDKGSPIVAPMVYAYQDDLAFRQMGSQKMIGPWLMIKHIVDPEAQSVSVRMPKGKWMDYHTMEWVAPSTSTDGSVTVTDKKGLFQLPAYIREGAIVPRYVFTKSKNERVHVNSGSALEWIILPSEEQTHFTWVDDDGATVAYQEGKVSSVDASQVKKNNSIFIVLDPIEKNYQTTLVKQHVRVFMQDIRSYRNISLNGTELHRKSVKFSGSDQVWIDLGRGSIDEKMTLVLTKEN
ncbi:MAG: DUF5110 domain-containing protein [Deltaproteobacteria bacterium]|nr:DUF5110 domain-containing protein [Deltaproteobacteria bacterium]